MEFSVFYSMACIIHSSIYIILCCRLVGGIYGYGYNVQVWLVGVLLSTEGVDI